eukprot:COSAG06_NODE_1845_length_8230_cov_12.038499_3_plen_84_part_00
MKCIVLIEFDDGRPRAIALVGSVALRLSPSEPQAVAMALLLALLALLLPGTARAAPGACPNSDAPCPNIVTILADDLVRAAVH